MKLGQTELVRPQALPQIHASMLGLSPLPYSDAPMCTYPHPSCTVNVWMKSASTQTWMCGNACGLTDSVRPNFIKGLKTFLSRFLICTHCKVVSINTSHLEAPSRFYISLMNWRENLMSIYCEFLIKT